MYVCVDGAVGACVTLPGDRLTPESLRGGQKDIVCQYFGICPDESDE